MCRGMSEEYSAGGGLGSALPGRRRERAFVLPLRPLRHVILFLLTESQTACSPTGLRHKHANRIAGDDYEATPLAERKTRMNDRVPPGQHLVSGFPCYMSGQCHRLIPKPGACASLASSQRKEATLTQRSHRVRSCRAPLSRPIFTA